MSEPDPHPYTDMVDQNGTHNGTGHRWPRWLPLTILAGGLVLFFGLDGTQLISLQTLADHKDDLQQFLRRAPILTLLLYMLSYIVVVAFSLPGGAVMTILGGFLFGTLLGGIIVVFVATIGATVVFLTARTAFHDRLATKVSPWIKRFEQGFQDGAVSYLLVLRLVPVFPFFIVNLAPAFLGISLRLYMFTTFIGIIPGSFVYASIGNGLDALLTAGQNPDLGLIFQPAVLMPLLGLSVLALLPLIYKKVIQHKGQTHDRSSKN